MVCRKIVSEQCVLHWLLSLSEAWNFVHNVESLNKGGPEEFEGRFRSFLMGGIFEAIRGIVLDRIWHLGEGGCGVSDIANLE